MSGDFDDFNTFLNVMSKKLSHDVEVKTLEESTHQAEIQTFLSDSRDRVQNIILPVFKDIEAFESGGFTAKIEDQGSATVAGLFFLIRGHEAFYFRVFSHSERLRMIFEKEDVKANKKVELAALKPSEINSIEVRRQLRRFLEEFK